MRYRKEIDGLRAFAVLPVILFHAGAPGFSGGYVGVDVFFVISGYLITTILLGELARDDFSIARFYERRARRILPALFFVMLCCIPFAWAWMMPAEARLFGRSLIAVVLFASNILFWKSEGYFSVAAELNPLLHTWSLAVEEQFYLFFPPFLALCWRFGRQRVFWIIVAGAAASLALAELIVHSKPSTAFFLLPTRVWELLAGSICAFLLQDRSAWRVPFVGFAGLLMILVPVAIYDHATPYPSLWTVPPVLGTALIILFAPTGTGAARFLSWRPFVGIGLISYSAYLWHQPIFAFARLRYVMDVPLAMMLALSVLSLLLAAFSWRFVERPFRAGGTWLPTRRGVFAASLAGCLAFAMVGGGWLKTGSQTALMAFALTPPQDRHVCTFEYGVSDEAWARCQADLGDRPYSVLVGDSHARQLSLSLREQLATRGQGLVSFYALGCLVVPGVSVPEGVPRCAEVLGDNDVWKHVARLNPDHIYLIQRWTKHIEGAPYRSSHGVTEMAPDRSARLVGDTSDPEQAQINLRNAIADFITQIDKLTVIGPTPEVGADVVRLAALVPSKLSYPYADYQQRHEKTLLMLHRAADYFDPSLAICPDGPDRRCLQQRDGHLLYTDDDHLSRYGADLVVSALLATR
ncbi:MAG: acyltransferase family protein [Paracoccus sp. (in: a-proteobacteria)]|uniref:acyltransferase family protein n=1 Tax=Paracoccus sp. TaxID=267 RepID=UPI0026E0A545|nr:acyltransferase family protein [Paracoccus sp. (in: a-proteobacteria)]MDO5612619.1 acyltransferase family protein [Paracoccus sp. (in: a-proteobacteria)]